MFSLFQERNSAITLDGSRVMLRPPRRGDAGAWAALRQASREFLQPWEPTWPADGASRAAFHRRRLQILSEWRSGYGNGFFIFQRDGATLLGGITLSNIRRGVADTASLGYWIGAPHARQGYSTEAVRCVLDYALGALRLHRVEAACVPENIASRALLLKCGFQEEGLARGYLKIDGRWRDHVTFAMLAGER
ncbi:MAG: GNAT family protein, partial [Alphaproteobacteria bacterium]